MTREQREHFERMLHAYLDAGCSRAEAERKALGDVETGFMRNAFPARREEPSLFEDRKGGAR